MRFQKATVVGIVGLALATGSCAPPEKSVVDNYFRAIIANDNQTLSSFAVVKFDKQVESWSIAEVGPEVRSPATLPDLAKKVTDAKTALDQARREYNNYFNEHPTEVGEARELLKDEQPIPRKLEEVAAEVQSFSERIKEATSASGAAKDELAREKKLVQLSVGDVANIETLEGEQVEKRVDLAVTIEGQSQNYVMTLRRYQLEAGESAARMMSRWLVYDLTPQ